MIQCATLTLILGLLAVSAPLYAVPSTPPETPAAAGSYRLRSEDVIEITVLGLSQLDKTLTILPDGTISYPRLGTIKAAGMTPQSLKEYLVRELDRFYNITDLTVTVRQLRTDRVTVRGAVRTPGIYDVRSGWTLRELLAAAGDLATPNGPPAPAQMRATLIRRNGERIPLQLAQLMSQAGAPDLPALEPDDVLLVEDLTIQVWVEGEVNSPGLITLPPGTSPADALQQAKGPTEKAALTQAYIRRGAQIIRINLRPIMSGKVGTQPLPPLQRYDTISIPENKNQFLVAGGVQRPGPYLLPEDEPVPLTKALGLAGGTVPRAGLKQVSLVQKVGDKFERTIVNVEEMFKKGELSRNVLIQPGDMIYVPDPKQPRGFNPLLMLQSAAVLFGFAF